jgi:hypothetical protein
VPPRTGARLPAWILAVGLAAIGTAPSGARAAGSWPSYGLDLASTRSQPRPGGINATTAPRLAPAWTRRRVARVAGTT